MLVPNLRIDGLLHSQFGGQVQDHSSIGLGVVQRAANLELSNTQAPAGRSTHVPGDGYSKRLA